MGWPYHFLKLSTDQTLERRILLDRYGLYAELSAVLPIAFFVVSRLTQIILKKATKISVNYEDSTSSTVEQQGETKLRRFVWWLGDEIEFAGQNLGRRDELIFGGLWTAWLLFLCTSETGNDYFHVTRRLGIVGTSQFPVQYLLSSKRLNPVAFAFRTSPKDVNRWHRVLCRITYFLISFHGVLYINHYIQVGDLGHAFFRIVPVLGMLGLLGMTILSATTLSVMRHYSHRIFYITHIAVASALPPVIWFHVPHSRVFMVQSLLILAADLSIRRFGMVTSSATIEMVSDTDLVKIVAKIPPRKLRYFETHPASYAYLSIPPASRPNRNPLSPSYLRYGLISNPFTVASVNEQTGELTFVARQMNGPVTQTLARLASLHPPNTKVALNIDGPYDAPTGLPNFALSGFDRVLLVAGGIGATFIMPLYAHVRAKNPAARVKLVWAVRDANEVSWSGLTSGDNVYDDDAINLFVTADHVEFTDVTTSFSSEDDDVEPNRLEKNNKHTKNNGPVGIQKRPDLQKIVGKVFRQAQHDRVAVFVCGPEQMARDVRKAVGVWVQRGRHVYFHNESFS